MICAQIVGQVQFLSSKEVPVAERGGEKTTSCFMFKRRKLAAHVGRLCKFSFLSVLYSSSKYEFFNARGWGGGRRRGYSLIFWEEVCGLLTCRRSARSVP